jgi:hypothetical protein
MITEPMQTVWIEGPLWLRTNPSNWPNLPVLGKTDAMMEGMKKEFKIFEYMTPITKNARRHDEVFDATAQRLFRHQPI